MIRKSQKISLGLFLMAFTASFAFAGGMGDKCLPTKASVPCAKEAWGFEMQALYMTMQFNDQQSFDVISTVSIDNSIYHDVSPNWGWGFKLAGSYLFNTGNDFTVSWYHLDDNKKIQRFSPGALVNFTSLTSIGYRIDPQWDAINAELGQHVDLGAFKKVRFFGGLQYAEFEINQSVSGVNVVGQQTLNINRLAEFGGVGPRVGVDLSYHVGQSFAIQATSAINLLIGSKDSNSNIFDVNSEPVNQAEKAHRTSIVPSIEAKVGGQYARHLLNGQVSIDAGWMVANYFNAFTTLGAQDDSDFVIQGPYLGARWVGEIV